MFLNGRSRAVLALFATILSFTSVATTAAFQTEEVRKSEQDTLSHPAHMLVLTARNGLKLFSIPAANDAEQSIKSKTTTRVFSLLESELGVFGGHLLTRTYEAGNLLATDLASGEVRELSIVLGTWGRSVAAASYSSGHLYSVVKLKTKDGDDTHALIHLDLHTFKTTKICGLASRRSQMQSAPRFSIMASPDGARVAVSEMMPAENDKRDKAWDQPPARVILATAGEREVVRTKFQFRTQMIFTGGGDYLEPPTFSWGSNDTLLLPVSFEFEERERLGLSDGGTPVGFQFPWEVKSIRVDTGKVESLLKLPKDAVQCKIFTNGSPQPYIETTSVSGRNYERSRYLIDFENKSLSDPNVISKDYQLKATKIKESYSLTFQGEVQEVHAKPGRVFPAADGKRVAWFALPEQKAMLGEAMFDLHRKNDHGLSFHGNSDLNVHDSAHGVRKLGTDWFTGGVSSFVCLWLTDSDLERSNKFDNLPLLK